MDVKINKSTRLLAFNTECEHPNLNHNMVFTNDEKLTIANTDEFWLFMFKSGLPWITSQTSEHFIPQHLNLDQLGVIDFDKGCYPGQEIIARLHFLGKVKKRMQYVKYQSEQAYVANTKAQIAEYDPILEFCSPAVLVKNKWHAQAIMPT